MKRSKSRAAPLSGQARNKTDTYETGTDDVGGTAGVWAVAGVGNSWLGFAGSEETHG